MQEHLHGLVYIVADKPTKDNVSAKVPLVGTKSYKTLLGWLADMNVDISRVRMYNQVDKPFDGFMNQMSINRAVELNQIKVLALGNKAADYLASAGIKEFFVLQHPSGLNRKLNDRKRVKLMLKECQEYVYRKETPKAENSGEAPAQQSS